MMKKFPKFKLNKTDIKTENHAIKLPIEETNYEWQHFLQNINRLGMTDLFFYYHPPFFIIQSFNQDTNILIEYKIETPVLDKFPTEWIKTCPVNRVNVMGYMSIKNIILFSNSIEFQNKNQAFTFDLESTETYFDTFKSFESIPCNTRLKFSHLVGDIVQLKHANDWHWIGLKINDTQEHQPIWEFIDKSIIHSPIRLGLNFVKHTLDQVLDLNYQYLLLPLCDFPLILVLNTFTKVYLAGEIQS